MKKNSFLKKIFPKKQEDSVNAAAAQYYKVPLKRRAYFLGKAVLLCIVINCLFYQELLAFPFLCPLGLWFFFQQEKREKTRRKNQLWLQFRDALTGLQVSIAAGYSVENSIKEARKDLEKIYGKKGQMAAEFRHIENQLEHGVPIEKLLTVLGSRSGIEDIQNFSQILIQSKRMGGNMRKILQECISSMEEQMDVKKEIQAMLASRKLEQKIMNFIPLGIILYMQCTSSAFLSVLYGNLAGICIMTICLGIYCFACIWGERLVDIEI